jgi:hypothetical protein
MTTQYDPYTKSFYLYTISLLANHKEYFLYYVAALPIYFQKYWSPFENKYKHALSDYINLHLFRLRTISDIQKICIRNHIRVISDKKYECGCEKGIIRSDPLSSLGAGDYVLSRRPSLAVGCLDAPHHVGEHMRQQTSLMGSSIMMQGDVTRESRSYEEKVITLLTVEGLKCKRITTFFYKYAVQRKRWRHAHKFTLWTQVRKHYLYGHLLRLTSWQTRDC